MKTFVTNRKDFLFADTVAGACATAVFHSLAETAKESGLDPFTFQILDLYFPDCCWC